MADLEKALRNLKVLVMRLAVQQNTVVLVWTPVDSTHVDPIPTYKSCDPTLKVTDVQEELSKLIRDLFPPPPPLPPLKR